MQSRDSGYPVRFEVDYPEVPSRGLALLGVLFLLKALLLIPHNYNSQHPRNRRLDRLLHWLLGGAHNRQVPPRPLRLRSRRPAMEHKDGLMDVWHGG